MNNIGNPFVECTSRDMSFKEVFHYWCNPFICYAIDQKTLSNSMTPVIIEGPRGSGKTMILKYISYFCQKELLQSTDSSLMKTTMLESIQKSGSLGIYFRYKDDFGTLFKFLNCSQGCKERLFSYYFEMYILDELFRVLLDLEGEAPSEEYWNSLVEKLNSALSENVSNLSELADSVANRIKKVDDLVRKSRYLESAENALNQLADGGSYITKVCKCIAESITELSNVKFLIIIDEYENAGEYQRILNTMIKQVDHTSNISFRVGVRPKGMTTLETNVGKEFLQIDRDFLLYVLQSQNMFNYKAFVKEIANRRLRNTRFFAENEIADIQLLLGKKENLDDEAKMLVKNNPYKHFDILKKKFSEPERAEIIEDISNPASPLMEMLNIVWILRGVSSKDVRMAMQGYISGKHKGNARTKEEELSRKYKLDYSDKYRSQLMFILLGIYGQNKKYYSFNTFAYLSSGAVNDFISLCRNVFYLLDESYYENIATNAMIPISIQARGAENTAIEQMDKIRLCSDHGTEMHCFAMNMGGLFRLLHRDVYAKYPETNQFAFDNEREIEDRPLLQEIRDSLIKWGVIVKKPRIQSISIGRRKGTLYYLNRIFCPIFGISFRTRGGYNFVLPTSLFECLLNEYMESGDIRSWKERSKRKSNNTSDNLVTHKELAIDPNQMSMFEV